MGDQRTSELFAVPNLPDGNPVVLGEFLPRPGGGLPRAATDFVEHRRLDLDQLGIPSEQEVRDTYSAIGGDVSNIDYYIAFSMFRLAAILAGVLRRGMDGNASDPSALERGGAYRLFAESGVDVMSSCHR